MKLLIWWYTVCKRRQREQLSQDLTRSILRGYVRSWGWKSDGEFEILHTRGGRTTRSGVRWQVTRNVWLEEVRGSTQTHRSFLDKIYSNLSHKRQAVLAS